ncbi:MAG: glycoside hydrolase family 97 protein [Bacteroidales bacterium]|nr:glycoside hydrolase family 97 protein [Bacteroidales bacterium]
MRWLPFLTLFLVLSLGLHGQKIGIKSPNNKLEASLGSSGSGAWYLTVNYFNEHRPVVAIPKIELGLSRSDQDFSTELKFLNAGKPRFVNEQYTAIHGKRSHCSNQANELTVFFENPSKAKMNLIIRAYNDGVVFRYEFPEKEGTFFVKDEFTSYTIPDSTMRWLTRFNPANEGLYSTQQDGNEQKDWGYPALFNTPDKACWFLIHEAGLNRTYCGTKLSNYGEKNNYKLTFPDQWNGRGTGETQPTVTLPWKSPWRVIMVGSLATIVESTLVDDVSEPSVIAKTDWIRPGKVSWNYWSDNHGTRSYKTVCAFADLAATMGWPYTLLDWEWDSMGDGGQLDDALDYIHSIGVKPLIWYNSGGDHTWVNATPKDRMLTHKNRMEEFARLKKMGIYGVKVDFFESEKQDMINYYIDILEDAARFEIMVYFHGCLVPRGWARTYPHLMTYEGVRGAEWYNNGPELTTTAPGHNTILPFTRNVVGGMDYTPVTFTNSQHPHITSYGHELALSVLFESGMQHMADRPEGYYMLPDAAKNFLREVPNAWDDTRLMDGYPGKEVVMARRKGDNWYIGGIHAEARGNKSKTLKFNFLPEGQKYRLTLIADGNYDTALSTRYLVVDKDSELAVNMLRRGGFAASLQPID